MAFKHAVQHYHFYSERCRTSCSTLNKPQHGYPLRSAAPRAVTQLGGDGTAPALHRGEPSSSSSSFSSSASALRGRAPPHPPQLPPARSRAEPDPIRSDPIRSGSVRFGSVRFGRPLTEPRYLRPARLAPPTAPAAHPDGR